MNIMDGILYFKGLFTLKLSAIKLGVIIAGIMSMLLEHIVSNYDKEDTPAIMFLAGIVFLSTMFIIADLIVGIIAARHKGEKIVSDKWGTTIGKFLGVMMYSVLAVLLLVSMDNSFVLYTVLYTPLVLSALKEYISIGNNLEKRFDGKKPYIFSLVDKIFELLEFKFFNTLERKLNDNNTVDNFLKDKKAKNGNQNRDT